MRFLLFALCLLFVAASQAAPVKEDEPMENDLPICILSNQATDQALVKECAICYEPMGKDPQELSTLSCGHTFHKKCHERWATVSNELSGRVICCLCRKKEYDLSIDNQLFLYFEEAALTNDIDALNLVIDKVKLQERHLQFGRIDQRVTVKALKFAAQRGSIDVLRALIDADVELRANADEALRRAIRAEQTEALALLIDTIKQSKHFFAFDASLYDEASSKPCPKCLALLLAAKSDFKTFHPTDLVHQVLTNICMRRSLDGLEPYIGVLSMLMNSTRFQEQIAQDPRTKREIIRLWRRLESRLIKKYPKISTQLRNLFKALGASDTGPVSVLRHLFGYRQ